MGPRCCLRMAIDDTRVFILGRFSFFFFFFSSFFFFGVNVRAWAVLLSPALFFIIPPAGSATVCPQRKKRRRRERGRHTGWSELSFSFFYSLSLSLSFSLISTHSLSFLGPPRFVQCVSGSRPIRLDNLIAAAALSLCLFLSSSTIRCQKKTKTKTKKLLFCLLFFNFFLLSLVYNSARLYLQSFVTDCTLTASSIGIDTPYRTWHLFSIYFAIRCVSRPVALFVSSWPVKSRIRASRQGQ